MPGNKENQEISVLGRLFSLEVLIVLMGAASLIFGLCTASMTHLAIGSLILVGTVLFVGWWRRQRIKKRLDTGD